MKKKILLCIAVISAAVIFGSFNIYNNHTFTLYDSESVIKSEQIQPLFGTVKVRGDSDTDVVFTNVETGEEFIIGYITHGMTETIRLKTGEWYSVKGNGNITLSPVNVRVE